MCTSDFLKQDGWFTFYDTPKELRGKPNYYLSDDDRLFWWDGTDEVKISEQLDKWLKELSSKHKRLKKARNILDVGGDFLVYFINTLKDADNYYTRIMPFQSMFYEFLQNGKDPDYIAAVKLFKNLSTSDEYRKSGKIIDHIRYKSWDLTSKNVTCNEARIKLKRYLSVMANRKLRKKYFDF